MTVIATATSSSAPAMARRLPSQCRTEVEASSPKMAPTVTPARSSPIVAVPMPRPALIAGSRGPHAETVIPPSPNAAVTVHRQRANAGRLVVTSASVTGALPRGGTWPALAWPPFRSGELPAGGDGRTTT